MRRLELLIVPALGVMVAWGCGGARAEVEVAANDESVSLVHGLEMAEAKDYRGALRHFEIIAKRELTARDQLRVAYTRFLIGEHQGALSVYSAKVNSPEVPGWLRDQLVGEIERVRGHLREGSAPPGTSLASAMLRGELALLRADEAVDQASYSEAYRNYQKAYQYTLEPRLRFEAALAATKAKQHAAALKMYDAYVGNSGRKIDEDMLYAITAEIERLEVIAAGGEPVTWESLADLVYESRSKGVGLDMGGGVQVDTNLEKASAGETDPGQETATEAGSFDVSDEASTDDETEDVSDSGVSEETAVAAAGESVSEEGVSEEEPEETSPVVAEATAPKSKSIRARRAARASAKERAKAEREEQRRQEQLNRQRGREAAAEAHNHKLDRLLRYLKAPNSAVRLKSVKELLPYSEQRVRIALENCMIRDLNINVRLAAINALGVRRSMQSLPKMRRAEMSSTNSAERAQIKKTIRLLLGTF